ncbi:hypothetical protein HYC85_010597 [Camellia sinensis]|uniref:Uncharacterized protein n=1 Tax=Camellia sinensis TaxID=4442 RepID=A0A7J7HIH8_CAMSI|nr:hypothetical protein HYC85_010597 [Camellia sinensis]
MDDEKLLMGDICQNSGFFQLEPGPNKKAISLPLRDEDYTEDIKEVQAYLDKGHVPEYQQRDKLLPLHGPTFVEVIVTTDSGGDILSQRPQGSQRQHNGLKIRMDEWTRLDAKASPMLDLAGMAQPRREAPRQVEMAYWPGGLLAAYHYINVVYRNVVKPSHPEPRALGRPFFKYFWNNGVILITDDFIVSILIVKKIVRPGCSQEVLNVAVSSMSSLARILSALSSEPKPRASL